MIADRLAPYNQDAVPPPPAFPPDPAAEERARAADERIIAQLGVRRAVEVATSADSVVCRATTMMGERNEHGERVHTPAEVLAVLADWHARHRYPTCALRTEARRG